MKAYVRIPNLAEMERNERMKRTRVAVLDYPEDGKKPSRIDFETPEELKDGIAELDGDDQKNSSVKFRLFVVEDLSREVIETLGARYDVDPAFFREHLVDYVWYNISKWSFSPAQVIENRVNSSTQDIYRPHPVC